MATRKSKAQQQEEGLEKDAKRKPKAAPPEAEPREGLEDESQERNREREGEPPAPGSDEDPAKDKRDESQERSAKVVDSSDELMPPNRSQSDGGLRREQLPVVREGEVWEDVRPSRDDHRRYVKIIDPNPDGDGRVLVKNEETYQESRISLERFSPEHGWARFAS